MGDDIVASFIGPDANAKKQTAADVRVKRFEAIAERMWPRLFAGADRRLSQVYDPTESKSVAAEVFHTVKSSVSRTIHRRKHYLSIENMESYLGGIYNHRISRVIAQEKKRRDVFEFVPTAAELEKYEGSKDKEWVNNLEEELLVREIISQAEDWVRDVLTKLRLGYKWPEIAAGMGLTSKQLRERVGYSLEKTRAQILKGKQNPDSGSR